MHRRRTGTDEPPKRHCRHHHNHQALDVLPKVRPRQLHSNSEQASGKHDTHDFKGYFIGFIAPGPGIEYVRAIWANDDTEAGA